MGGARRSYGQIVTTAKKKNALPIQPGDVKMNRRDVNGDGVIDNYDMVKGKRKYGAIVDRPVSILR